MPTVYLFQHLRRQKQGQEGRKGELICMNKLFIGPPAVHKSMKTELKIT